MLGRKERDQLELFMTGSLRQLVPDDHVLARVDRVLDLSWLHGEVADLYCSDNGRPGIDPEVAVRLMLAGFLLGIVHDRRLMREAQVNIAIRWFVGYGLHEVLPDHSSLTRIRQRWGEDRFRRIFERTVQACIDAKIAKGEVVHVDASLIRADVSWDSLAVRHVEAVQLANEDTEVGLKRNRKTGKFKKVCTTDPDASMATNGRNRRLEPAYKQHAIVDDLCGVVLDVAVTTGEINEGQMIVERVDAAQKATGLSIRTITADAGYAYAKVFAAFERRGIDALIPAKTEPIRSPVPLRRFRYDAKHDILKCLRGKTLHPKRPLKYGRFFYSRARDCAGCDLAAICLSKGRANKAVVVGDDYPALIRARRRRERWSEQDKQLYQRHRWRSEGYHGEAKTWHGLARAVRRGLTNMTIQAYLTATAVNLKRLAAALSRHLLGLVLLLRPVGNRRGPLRRHCGSPDRHIVRDTRQAGNVCFFNSPMVHFYRNIFSHVPATRVRDVSHMLKAIHAQESRMAAEAKANSVIAELRLLKMAKAADLVEQAVGETLTYHAFPDIHWQKIRTNNPLERIMREIRRRTRVVGAFPDGQSCLNLAAARLRHIAGTQWSTKRYMNMRPLYQAAQTETEAVVA